MAVRGVENFLGKGQIWHQSIFLPYKNKKTAHASPAQSGF
jgi:hypothetical protein